MFMGIWGMRPAAHLALLNSVDDYDERGWHGMAVSCIKRMVYWKSIISVGRLLKAALVSAVAL